MYKTCGSGGECPDRYVWNDDLHRSTTTFMFSKRCLDICFEKKWNYVPGDSIPDLFDILIGRSSNFSFGSRFHASIGTTKFSRLHGVLASLQQKQGGWPSNGGFPPVGYLLWGTITSKSLKLVTDFWIYCWFGPKDCNIGLFPNASDILWPWLSQFVVQNHIHT